MTPLAAQSRSLRNEIELGATIAYASSSGLPEGDRTLVPRSGRVAFVSARTPWGVEVATEFGRHRVVNGARFREFGAPITLVRRIGRGHGVRGVMGTYASFGFTMTRVTPNDAALGARLYGLVGALGQRVAVGPNLLLRPEVVVTTDRGTTKDGALYPGLSAVYARLGVAWLGF